MTRIWADLHGFSLCLLGVSCGMTKNSCKSAQIRVIRVPMVSQFPKQKRLINMPYYELPLKAEAVMRGKRATAIDVRTSITQNLKLLLKTMSLRYDFDPSYGSILNKQQYVTPPQKGANAWRTNMRENIQSNLKMLLTEYEPRLKITDVFVEMEDNKRPNDKLMGMVLVRVRVEGHLTLGRKEKYRFPDSEVESEAQEAFPLYIPVGTK
jgi:predicted component of type VI protein secretion system